MPRRGLFITGTGTEVGKSIVAASIIAALTARGEQVAAFKPAVSGLDDPPPGWPPDHELLASATGWQDPADVAPHRFGPAVSPHFAAANAEVTITLDPLISACEAVSATCDTTVCEGVGGLLVPLALDPPLSVLDLVKAIALPVVVATHTGLGTISDTRLTVDRLLDEGLTVAGVVLSGWPDAPSAIERSNLLTLRDLLAVDVVTLPLIDRSELAAAGAKLPLTKWLSEIA